ncbi:hypothetical protein [Algoriphagus sp. CAU 1675]|uniref:hypothetical protein n=1 Tax=Algoriphagus sp. CAU 1675 TaxID=3032597 RepID=UPI0023DA1A73|nr:hypothetical protein [Algoriphagus sp. CAU 1675]MDF2157228.1 hypothetical protein [Algoriphagus sp. CAU 1675]
MKLIYKLFISSKSQLRELNLRLCVVLLIFVSLGLDQYVMAQESPAPTYRYLKGSVTATNNGISLIPSFTLGRPAVFFDMSFGGERLSFDPMFRFAMDGKPWTFVFWWRYKVIKKEKFTLSAGIHPAFMFAEKDVIIGNGTETMLTTRRFIAREIVPTFKLSSRVSLGLYYLHGNGFDPDSPKSSDFVGVNTSITNLPLFRDLSINMNPQFYFLKVDNDRGTYVTSTFTLKKKDFPLAFQSVINQKIKSEVAGEDLVWNIGLVYSIDKKFERKD